VPKLKNPLFSQEARGGIAGLVYNTWRGVNYCKTNTSPTGQGTAARLAAQALLKLITARWKALLESQRAAWRLYATDHPVTSWTGAPMRLTGQNWFMRCNISCNRILATTVNDPPVIDAPDPILGMEFKHTTTYLEILWTAPVAAPDRIDIWMVGPLSAGIAPKIQRAKFLQFANAESFAGVILVNNPAVGRWTIFVRVLSYATGLSSTWISAYVDVVAP
jgi:hypothetical protein